MSQIPLLERPSDGLQPSRPPTSGATMLAIAMSILAIVAMTVVWIATRPDATPSPAPAPVPTAADEQPPAAEEQPPADDEITQPAVRYDEELRANWDVTGVLVDDVLNVRRTPGVAGAIFTTLPPDAAELESTGRIASVGESLWREIVVPGDGTGWVNARYLSETAPPAEVRYSEELRANWDVTGVAADDVLNVRVGPGVTETLLATLAPDVVELESTGRIATVEGSLWREIVVPGDGTGWVNAAFLTPTR